MRNICEENLCFIMVKVVRCKHVTKDFISICLSQLSDKIPFLGHSTTQHKREGIPLGTVVSFHTHIPSIFLEGEGILGNSKLKVQSPDKIFISEGGGWRGGGTLNTTSPKSSIT